MRDNGDWQIVTSENSGLAADHVTGIADDGAGNLWFATYGGGLCRCNADGQDWRTYRAADGSLPNDYVGAVTADGAGRVWAVCDATKADEIECPGGLCALAPDGTWQVYPRAAGEDCILALEADRQGRLWLRMGGLVVSGRSTQCEGMREGPSRFEGGQWRAFDGTTWAAYDGERAAAQAWYPHRSHGRGLGWEVVGDTMWLLEAVQLASPSSTGPFGLNIGLIPDMGSFMYDYCLTAYDGREWKKQASLPGGFRFGELAVDGRGDEWVSLVTLGDMVMGGGVARFDGQEWTVFNKSTGLPSDYVVALSTDSRGNVWVSTMMGDLSRWDGSGWTYFPGRQGGRGDQDLGRCTEDRQGRLWFPSKGGAVVYVGKA